MSNIHQRSRVLRTTAKPSAVRNKYDPRIGSLVLVKGLSPIGTRYPCPKCDEVYFTIKFTDNGKITICHCGYETIGEFKAVIT